MSRNRTAAALVALGLAGTLVFAHPTPVSAQSASVPTCSLWSAQNNKIVLNVKFPGLPVTECIKSDGVKGSYAYIGTFGDYLVTFYQWFAGAAGVLAVFMVMFGGFQWLTAAGNPGRIGQAKESITGAVVGLILLLGSYVLLNTISPAFVAFKPLSPRRIERLTVGFATCYDNTPTSGGTTSTSSGTSGIAPAAACSVGGCSPLQNSACGSYGGACGCSLACQAGEKWVNFSYCATAAQGLGGVAAVFASANPGDPTIIPEKPATWGDIYDAYRQATGRSKIEKKGIAEWLKAYGAVKGCSWLFKAGPQAFAFGCIAPATVLGFWQAFSTLLPQENELAVSGGRIICCQNTTDTTKCTARSPVESSKTGTCEAPGSGAYFACADSTPCGEVNPNGIPAKIVAGIDKGCIGVTCSNTSQACILFAENDNSHVINKPGYGCKDAYDSDPYNPLSKKNAFEPLLECGTMTSGRAITDAARVGIQCPAGQHCAFVDSKVGKWYQSYNYEGGRYPASWNNGTAECYPSPGNQ